MKAADIPRANSILAALSKLDDGDRALAKGPISSAGVRCADSYWLQFPSDMHNRIASMIKEYHEAERARLGRLAAQIGLTL